VTPTVTAHDDGSLTIDNASVQRLMDYGLLHRLDTGWYVGAWPQSNKSHTVAPADEDAATLAKSRVRDRLHRHTASGTLRTEILIYDKDVKALLACSDPDTVRLAYKNGYQEGIEDGDGIFDREACEEGWLQYAEQLPERIAERLASKPADDGLREALDKQTAIARSRLKVIDALKDENEQLRIALGKMK